MKPGISVRRLVFDALLAAVALTVFVVELMIPLSVGIPGVKLGLANIVTVSAVFLLSPWDALGILLTRILLGALVTGQTMALFYSLAGGLLCWCSMLVMRRLVTERQIWASSVVGAVFHNLGQTAVAAVILHSAAVFWYLPFLLAAGCLAGLLTGAAAQALTARLAGRLRFDAGERGGDG